jgi:hypothetical protein
MTVLFLNYDSSYIHNPVYSVLTCFGESMRAVAETEIFTQNFQTITGAIMNIKRKKSVQRHYTYFII